MTNIQALSKDTIKVETGGVEVEISIGDKLVFQRNFGVYDEGQKVVVEPEISPDGNYVLKSWSETMSVHYIGEDLIKDIVSRDVVEIKD
jgi:hypothetical protein